MEARSKSDERQAHEPVKQLNTLHSTAESSQNLSMEELMNALSSDDPKTRLDARKILVQRGAWSVTPLLKQLQAENSHVRWEAAKALCELHKPQAAQGLVEALDDDDRDVRWVAAEGLAALGHAAIEPLLQGLIRNGHSTWMREGAGHVLHALQKTEDPRVTESVLAALENRAPIFDVPVAAFSALGKLHEIEDQVPGSFESIMREAASKRLP